MKFKVMLPMLAVLLSISAMRANAETVGPLKITHLSPFIGKKITLLFVQGQRPIVGTEDSQLSVIDVKQVVPSIDIRSDSIDVKPVNIPRSGIGRSNFLVVAVHTQTNFFWLNADSAEGKPQPRDPRLRYGQLPLEGENASLKIQAFSRSEFDGKIGNAIAIGSAQGLVNALVDDGQPKPIVLELQP